MERRLKKTALNIDKKEDHKNYQLRRDNRRGIRYVERKERIRQKYFRVWPMVFHGRGNIYASLNIAFVLEEEGYNIGVKGWFMDTRDDPMGIHGVVEGTKTTFKRFKNLLDDWKDNDEIGCYVRRKPGYIKKYSFHSLLYLHEPYEYDLLPVEERITTDLGLFQGYMEF